MKTKRNVKNLYLSKETISNLESVQGGAILAVKTYSYCLTVEVYCQHCPTTVTACIPCP